MRDVGYKEPLVPRCIARRPQRKPGEEYPADKRKNNNAHEYQPALFGVEEREREGEHAHRHKPRLERDYVDRGAEVQVALVFRRVLLPQGGSPRRGLFQIVDRRFHCSPVFYAGFSYARRAHCSKKGN